LKQGRFRLASLKELFQSESKEAVNSILMELDYRTSFSQSV